MAGGGGGRRWQEELEPELRPRMFQKILANIAGVCRAVNKSLPERLHEHAAHVEQIAFQTAKDRMDYMRKISDRMGRFQNRAPLQAAADHQHQMHMVHQMQMANTVQDIQGGNSLFTATPQAMPMLASPLRPPFQSPNQHMTHPFASINVNQGPSDMMAMLYQTFNSQPATVASVAQSIQSSQQIMQPIAMHSHNQRPAMQLQPTNVARYHPASMAQLQGQPIAQPNGHQNHLLRQNFCAYAQHLQPTVQQQHFGITQQQVGEQRHEMLGANVVKMNDGYSGGWNNQQNAGWASGIQPLKACEQVALKRQTNMETQSMPPAQRQVTVNQQSNVHCPSPQNQARMESAGQVDWREEIIQQIKSLKDTYFSELMELGQNIVLPRLAKEQLKSLPREKADTYNRMSRVKSSIGVVLELFQLKKSLETYRGKLPMYEEMIRNILSYRWKRKANAEMNTGQETESCPRQLSAQTIKLTSDIAPFTGGKSNQQKLPADESIGQMSQNVVTTPSAGKKTHSNQLQGVTSPCFSIKSPEFEALQSSSIKDVGLCCMLSPIDNLGVTSPNALLKSRSQSPIAKPGFGAAASPCVSVKSTLTSTVEKSEFLEAASSCASVKSASPSAIAESGVVPVASPSDSDSSFLLHNNAEVNGCNQNTPTKLLTPDSPCQTQTPVGQAEDQEHGEAETQVAKKPIDRLIAAVLSSSPAVLRSSVNLIESALSAMDSVPLRIGSSIKMKRVYDVTSPSESPTLGSMDGSTVTFEFDASDSASSRYPRVKRQKTQNTKDALLDEIEAVNSRLIDTVISITSDDREDEITSGDSVTLIKLSYTPVSLAPSLKSPFATSGNHQPLVMPMTLLIAADYPRSSPVIMDNEGDGQLRTKFSCISMVADAAFRLALRNLQEPRSLKETAMVWDSCVRSAITEYACQLGGGGASGGVRVGSAHERREMHAHWNRTLWIGSTWIGTSQ